LEDVSVDYFFFQAEDGIRGRNVTGVQTCALPIFAENARQKWTQSPFIFCADNDHAIRVNKGIVSATKAAELTGGTVIFPAFTDRSEERRVGKEGQTSRARDGY